MSQNTITETITLYFTQGSSDKIYTAAIEEVEADQYLVNFAYGRRGATLKTGTKTKKPVAYDAAKKAYDKLVKSKTVKGYKPGDEGPQYVHMDSDARDTGVHCQLLNPLEEAEVVQYIEDDAWWAQEKQDGKRMLLWKTADGVTAINRTGFSVGAPDVIINRAQEITQSYLVDGEAVGETLYVFDLLELDGKDIRTLPYAKRLAHLEGLGLGSSVSDPIVVVETAKTPDAKQQLYDRLNQVDAEGLVFKNHTAAYTVGRPNSGGNQMKFKFYATASVLVTKVNDKRSVAVAVFDGANQVEIGNVTIPANKDVPAVDDVVEVRYLYAYEGGSLYQPTYIGVRDDISVADCSISQLKYKREVALA
ncbi:MAG: RNA ligase family protein [Chloroflexota bacterium]